MIQVDMKHTKRNQMILSKMKFFQLNAEQNKNYVMIFISRNVNNFD